MRLIPWCSWLLLILAAVLTQAAQAQTQNRDCRLDPSTLEPLVRRFNPYFADHKWDKAAQMEMAKLDPNRLLVITQDGCKRHHIKFTMMVEPGAARNSYPFWLEEVNSLLEKVFWERAEYASFQADFAQHFSEKFQYHGFNNEFNFPVGSRNFICSVYFHPERGGRVSIEMVQFLFKEKIETRSRQINPEEDDGWLGQDDRP